jgi:hypothetical protein
MSIDDERKRRARQQAEARYGFLWHLPIYVVVNLGLVAIWFYSGQGFFWPAFPIIFWGLGVFSHYVAAYRHPGGSWIDWERKKFSKRKKEILEAREHSPAHKSGSKIQK